MSDDRRAVITDAQPAHSDDLNARQRRYLFSMGLRTACFIAMFFLPGVWRWVALAGAALLPAVAVIFANARDTRTASTVEPPDQVDDGLPVLTTGPVIPGELDDEPR